METATQSEVKDFKSFKPKRGNKSTFWYSIGIENAKKSPTEAIRQGFKPLVYQKIIKRTNLSQTEFNHVTLIPVSTIKRRLKKQERFNTQESDAMYRLAMLLKLAIDLFNDEERAQKWIRESVYGLGGKRPLDMVSTTADFEVFKDLIGRIKHGVFS